MSERSFEDWAAVPFDPAKASTSEWARYHEYRRIRHAESQLDEPIAPDEVVEAHLIPASPTWHQSRYTVEHEDRTVAYLLLVSPKPDAPEYPSNKHLVYTHLGVIAPYRRRGLGTLLLRTALEELDNRGARVLSTECGEDDGHEFARWCGASAKQVERYSRLDWSGIDWDQVDRWIAGLSIRAPGARLELFPDRLPDEFLEEYCPVRTEFLNLMPWGDAEHGEIVVTPESMGYLYKKLDSTNTHHHTYICREPDSTISGITDVSWMPDVPHEVDQWFTGVHPDYRGRGIGKAIKAAMVRYVDGRYDGLKWMRTGNATTNDAMLSINERLGFAEYRCETSYQIERDDLAAVLDRAHADQPKSSR